MKLILRVSYKQEYLKSHKSVETKSEKLEDMLNDFLSGKILCF